ncbi:Polar amino acid ABC transporter inner membrane protein (plasmid) [Sodalis praecaptivus]|uniref:Polar amino acid ABC transporter inner membrane protein n=1 Tax=Sodalis praecaptivus TaxID=1239307 RepID=W0I4Q0_9GAMM|nr:amino acid ABC transporter permease [Sodalis praecaptivus]AHF79378.1 Polar amino acid ABC transporter inner membrane protein [Sodalis praecaptivus]
MGYNWQFGLLYQYWPVFLNGAIITLEITFGATLIGLLIGLPVGILRSSTSRLLRFITTVYVEVIRSTPALVQIVWVYYCVPILFNIKLGAESAVILTLGIHCGAYVAEIVRAGVEGVDKGQFMAARSIGMSYYLTIRRIILPQAVQRMIPPFINEFANLMKLSTLGSVIAVYELLQSSNNLISLTYRPLEVYTFLALVFFAITYPWIWMSRRLENKIKHNA